MIDVTLVIMFKLGGKLHSRLSIFRLKMTQFYLGFDYQLLIINIIFWQTHIVQKTIKVKMQEYFCLLFLVLLGKQY
jgi:hypothetical protein